MSVETDCDDFTDAKSHTSTETETDCDCFEDYTCEFHCDPKRYDCLFEEAITSYQHRCKANGPNPLPIYEKLRKITKCVIKQYADNIDQSTMHSERMIHFINLAQFLMSEPGINHTKYQEIIMFVSDNLYGYRQRFPHYIYVQRIYRDWARYLLEIK